MSSDYHNIPPAYGESNRAVLRVSIVYILTGFVLFCIMGILGLMMRLQHAGWIDITADWFYRIMTIHGAGMVGAMLMAAMGGMTAALARTIPFSARWLWISYVAYSLSVPFLLYSTIIGRFAGGWTALDPLPYSGGPGGWDKWAGVMMYLTFLAIGVGFLIWSVHTLIQVSKEFGGIHKALMWRYMFTGKLDEGEKVPNTTQVAGAATSLIGIVTVLAGVAVLVPLFFEAAGVGVVDALFSKNLIMVYGHAIANNTMYISVGIVYALLPLYTHRAGHMYRLVPLAWNMTIILIFTPVPHHLYQDFSQPTTLHVIGQIASWTIAPEVLLITIIGSMASIYRSGMKWAVPSVLLVLGFWGWVFGGIAAIMDASIAINNITHNTLWVPGHFHSYYLLGACSFIWAYMFYLLGDLAKITEWKQSKVAAWIYGVGGIGFTLMFFFSAIDSIPRRYAAHLDDWEIYSQIAVPFVILIILALLWLIADMMRALGPAWRRISSHSGA